VARPQVDETELVRGPDQLASPTAIHMCDSPPPDGCQGDPLRGQFDQTDGHGLALPVRSFLNADTAIGRQGLTRSTPLGQSETAPN
jgi:hypothetical protein